MMVYLGQKFCQCISCIHNIFYHYYFPSYKINI